MLVLVMMVLSYMQTSYQNPHLISNQPIKSTKHSNSNSSARLHLTQRWYYTYADMPHIPTYLLT